MLQTMMEFGNFRVAQAGHRNLNQLSNEGSHWDPCAIQLTHNEAHEMRTKLGWLPVNILYVPED